MDSQQPLLVLVYRGGGRTDGDGDGSHPGANEALEAGVSVDRSPRVFEDRGALAKGDPVPGHAQPLVL